MPDKCPGCPAPSADMDGFIVSGPGGAPRSEGSGVSSSEGPFVQEAPQTGHVVIMGTLGADGTPGSLPDVPQVGWAYVAEDAGTYGGVQATEGDMVYCMSLNPVRWGVLQADSDDAGQDLASVSAAFSCGASPSLSLTSTKASGASSVQTVDMSCLNDLYGSLESLSASFGCDPSPVLSLTSAKADGTSSSQDVDMSCLVPPVFAGSANGLVPAYGAVQNYLLAGDGTWMRPATNAEIDALFAEAAL